MFLTVPVCPVSIFMYFMYSFCKSFISPDIVNKPGEVR